MGAAKAPKQIKWIKLSNHKLKLMGTWVYWHNPKVVRDNNLNKHQKPRNNSSNSKLYINNRLIYKGIWSNRKILITSILLNNCNRLIVSNHSEAQINQGIPEGLDIQIMGRWDQEDLLR